MSAPQVKGYCPGALHPMASGDGLVVRIRPFGGRLSAAQAAGIATLSERFGNGVLDLSSRANVQLRGVSERDHPALIDGLRELGLIDGSVAVEQRRNIIVTPFWRAGDETQYLTDALTQALSRDDAPALPHKFGFAVDTGPSALLQNDPADIRLELGTDGGLLLIAQGLDEGKRVTAETAVAEALALARWFMQHRGQANRMAQVLAHVPAPAGFTVPRQTQTARATPGATDHGMLCGFAFGQITAMTLAKIAAMGPLRITPWRMVLIEGAKDVPQIDGVITDPLDPLLRITACTGAPGCAQALGDTRTLARTLAPHLKTDQTLHISGCTKGCAHPKPAATTITATISGYALTRDGRASDTPTHSGLTPAALTKTI